MKISTILTAAAFAALLPAVSMAQSLTTPSQRELVRQRLTNNDPQVIAHRIAANNGGNLPIAVAKAQPQPEGFHNGAKQVFTTPRRVQPATHKAAATKETPYFEDFLTQDAFNEWTIIDANGDRTVDDGVVNGSWWCRIDSSSMWSAPIHEAQYRGGYSGKTADDWLISPPIKLKKGNTYTVQFAAEALMSIFPEILEVKWGQGTTAEAMTGTVMGVTTITNNPFKTFSNTIAPTADGEYNIGFHALSTTDGIVLTIDSVLVEVNGTAEVPGSVQNLTVTAGEKGARKVDISFTVPSTNIIGEALTSPITSIQVLRGDSVIKTYDNPTSGETITLTDADETMHGTTTYKVRTFNAIGEGQSATATVFVGVDVPKAVSSSKLNDVKPSLTASWEAVTEGQNGGYIDPSTTSYVIGRIDSDDYGSYVTAIDTTAAGVTTYDLKLDPDTGAMRFAAFAIAPLNETGRGEFTVIGDHLLIIGKPASMPIDEVFPDGHSSTSWLFTTKYEDSAIPEFATASHDNVEGSRSMQWTPEKEDALYFSTGKIDLGDAAKPTLIFSVEAKAKTASKVTVIGRKNDREVETTLATVDFSTQRGTSTRWVTTEVDLSPLKGGRYASILFQFEGNASSGSINFDDIHILNKLDNNLSVDIEAPTTAKQGKASTVYIDVKNIGANDASDYTINLYEDGNVIYTEKAEEKLEFMKTYTAEVEYTPSVFKEHGDKTLKAEVVFAADNDNTDNTASADVYVKAASAAPVTDLTGEYADGKAALTWKAPESTAETITEDFESYTPWEISDFGEWSTIDNDLAWAGSPFSNITLPHTGGLYAFIVTNLTEYGLQNAYPGHSGVQYLSSFYGKNYNGSEYTNLDNWLVSPELSGKAQTISFWAKNTNDKGTTYPENLNILYSTADKTTSDFTLLKSVVITSGDWEQVEAELPEGTKYFAIEQKNDAGKSLWLGIDDISYQVDGSDLTGFNIYADSVLVTTVEPTVLTFTADAAKTYSVTAVYANGSESLPVTIGSPTGIESVTTDSTKPATIYTIGGIRVGKDVKSLPSGIYIVDGKKMVVK